MATSYYKCPDPSKCTGALKHIKKENCRIDSKKKYKKTNKKVKEKIKNLAPKSKKGNGYAEDYSMSNNAIKAYSSGIKPLSKHGKGDLEILNNVLENHGEERLECSVNEYRKIVETFGYAGYHHTSKFYNKTDFFSVSDIFLIDAESCEENDIDWKEMLEPEIVKKRAEAIRRFIKTRFFIK